MVAMKRGAAALRRLWEWMRSPNSMDEAGGWILIFFGLAIVALACVFADEPTIAPIFAFLGVASVVLGALFRRLEDVELTSKGLKARLTRILESDELTADV